MFTTFMLESPGLSAMVLDTTETLDEAIVRYAEIGFEDEPARLLGRAVFIRDDTTGAVHAVGSYRPHGGDADHPPVLAFTIARKSRVVRFQRVQDWRGEWVVIRDDFRIHPGSPGSADTVIGPFVVSGERRKGCVPDAGSPFMVP